MWNCLWSQSEKLPSTPYETIKKVYENTLSKILKLLNDLGSTMLEDRMNALMLLYIHQDLSLNYDQVIEDFVRRNPGKILLVNRLG